MKNKLVYIISFFAIVFFYGCSDFLDIKDESGINPAIWDDEASAKLYLNNIYKLCQTPFGSEDLTTSQANLSDETTNMSSSILIGTLNSNSISTYSADTYAIVRLINIALNNMKSSLMPEDAKKRTYGQLYFFRAWVHWRLVRLYGGVPYMRDEITFEIADSIKNAPRNKTSECISYMEQDLDSAIANLPAAWSSDEYGRITRTAAAAFKGRILLFYASPQFTPTNSDPTTIQNRWKKAFEANLAARDLCATDGIKLMDITVDSTTYWPARKDLNKVFLTKKTAKNTEVILVTPYAKDVKMHGYESAVCPAEYTLSRPSLAPSWDLVIAFPMRDGSLPFSYVSTSKNTRNFTGNGGDKTKFYLNRDSRFYSTIAYNGCYFQLEGDQTKRLWTFNFKRKGSGGTFYGENTTIDKVTTTGFMNRKMVDPVLNRTEMGRSITDWVEIRYAEVLLNLAECAFEYEGANSSTGIDCVKQIRERAGILAGTDGSYGFNGNIAAGFTPIEIVMNERRVEFAFEGKRFWDLRRRNMFTEDLGAKILKLNGWQKEGSGFTFGVNNITRDSVMLMTKALRDTIKFENLCKIFKMTASLLGPSAYRLNYVCIPDSATLKVTTTGNYNFFDIPGGILTRSPAVAQSYGWQYGTFNPFE